jgi:hypothetical protein
MTMKNLVKGVLMALLCLVMVGSAFAAIGDPRPVPGPLKRGCIDGLCPINPRPWPQPQPQPVGEEVVVATHGGSSKHVRFVVDEIRTEYKTAFKVVCEYSHPRYISTSFQRDKWLTTTRDDTGVIVKSCDSFPLDQQDVHDIEQMVGERIVRMSS